MPAITYDKFDVGLDQRQSPSVADSNKLQVLTNAYVTTGKVIRKRPGLSFVGTLEAGTHGLTSANGVLNTFYTGSTITHADAQFLANKLNPTVAANVTSINYADVFNSTLFVSAEFDDATNTRVFFVDGTSPNQVTMPATMNEPRVFVKQSSRIYGAGTATAGSSGGSESVYFCENGDPTNWTTATSPTPDPANDPGFLPVGNQARGQSSVTALAQYDGRLSVFFSDGVQLWDVDTDATNNTFYKGVDSVGCNARRTPKIFAGDIIFLSQSGVRSLTTQTYTANLQDVDVGSPIDDLVREMVSSGDQAQAAYFPRINQYWVLTPKAGTTTTVVFVYTYSRSAKVYAWSQFELPVKVDYITDHGGQLYLRSGDDVYQIDDTNSVFEDQVPGAADQDYEMRIELPFLNFKSPGVLKYISGFDIVVTGPAGVDQSLWDVNVQFRYDPNDTTKITDPIKLVGDTRPLQTIPMEISTTAIAPVITSKQNVSIQLDALTFYYENMGPF